jgi:hypothetical protein
MIPKYAPKQDDLTTESLLTKFVIFIGQKNLSLDLAASDEFYDLLINFIAYGLQLGGETNAIKKAQEHYRHIKQDTLKNKLIESAHEIHRLSMGNFSQLAYTSIAIDEGKTGQNNNLDFVLENPTSKLHPFPATTIRMQRQTTQDYVVSLAQGISEISKYKISIGSVVCDGNTAQKKAFNHSWKNSLPRRSQFEWMKRIIFIPCLCHRTHNSFKNRVLHDENLGTIVQTLHDLSKLCRDHIKELGAACPAHIETRWLYDFDIVQFLHDNQQRISKFHTLQMSELTYLRDVLAIFKALINIFENTSTPHWSAFKHLENAYLALLELKEEYDNPYADTLADSFNRYTLMSKDSGLWVISYLFTPEGREDFHHRLTTQTNPSGSGFVKLFHIKKSQLLILLKF